MTRAALACHERRVGGSLNERPIHAERQVRGERGVLYSSCAVVGFHLHAPGADETGWSRVLPVCVHRRPGRKDECHCRGQYASEADSFEIASIHVSLPSSVIGP
jgi:hypothetical protein